MFIKTTYSKPLKEKDSFSSREFVQQEIGDQPPITCLIYIFQFNMLVILFVRTNLNFSCVISLHRLTLKSSSILFTTVLSTDSGDLLVVTLQTCSSWLLMPVEKDRNISQSSVNTLR